ncbi:hypothetical protein [Falsibacillus pallidus]|uniref:hypothetical protein n=1 Tax=Falsibacillus pallidus TaxID=493781 RepID=UPI003D98A6E1
MSKSRKLLFCLTMLLSFLFIFGCSNGLNKNHIPFKLIASEKTWPSNFRETAFERKETPYYWYLVKRIQNQTDYEKTWEHFAFKDKAPTIDFKKNDAIFIGVEESGSCPSKIEFIKKSPDNKTLTIPLTTKGGDCTADASPRSFVIQIDKKISNKVKSVTMEESRIKTEIPIED